MPKDVDERLACDALSLVNVPADSDKIVSEELDRELSLRHDVIEFVSVLACIKQRTYFLRIVLPIVHRRRTRSADDLAGEAAEAL